MKMKMKNEKQTNIYWDNGVWNLERDGVMKYNWEFAELIRRTVGHGLWRESWGREI